MIHETPLKVDYDLAFTHKDYDVYPVLLPSKQAQGFEWWVCPLSMANLPILSDNFPHFKTREEAIKYVDDNPTGPLLQRKGKNSNGDKVVRNPETWEPESEFDEWGRGQGIGEVVEPPFPLEDEVDVRWEAGRCFEKIKGLKLFVEPKGGGS